MSSKVMSFNTLQLRNVRNSCYINASLNFLFSLQEFRSFVINNSNFGIRGRKPVCNALYNLFTKGHVIQDVEELRMALRMLHPDFAKFDTCEQHDLEEFLLSLMKAIKKETNDIVPVQFWDEYCTGSLFVLPGFINSDNCPRCRTSLLHKDEVFQVFNVNIPQN